MTSGSASSPVSSPSHGHQVTVYAQKQQPDVPDRAELHDGVRVEHIDAGPVPATPATASRTTRACWTGSPPSAGRCAAAGRASAPTSCTRCAGRAAWPRWPPPATTGYRSCRSSARSVSRNAATGCRPPGRTPRAIRLEPAIGRSAAAVVATHSAEVSDLASLGVHRSSIRVVPWGVDTDMFTPEGPVAKRNGRPRLLTVADLKERAALETLLRALTRVPGAELMVVGGPARAELARDAAYVNLARFAGDTGHHRPRDLYRRGRARRDARPAAVGQPGRQHLPVRALGDDVAAGHGVRDAGHRSPGGRSHGRRGRRDDRHLDPAGTARPCWPSGSGSCSRTPCSWRHTGSRRLDRARSRYSWDRIASETLAVYDRAAVAAA